MVCFQPSLATPEGLSALKEDLTSKTGVWAQLCSQKQGIRMPKGCPDFKLKEGEGRWCCSFSKSYSTFYLIPLDTIAKYKLLQFPYPCKLWEQLYQAGFSDLLIARKKRIPFCMQTTCMYNLLTLTAALLPTSLWMVIKNKPIIKRHDRNSAASNFNCNCTSLHLNRFLLMQEERSDFLWQTDQPSSTQLNASARNQIWLPTFAIQILGKQKGFKGESVILICLFLSAHSNPGCISLVFWKATKGGSNLAVAGLLNFSNIISR